MDYTDPYENIEDNQYFNIFQRLKVPIIISYSITFILGTIGNGLVIWIAGFRMKKTVDILWFLNLAVADFAFDILFPLQITEWIMDGHWPLGQIMCKIIFTVLFLNMSVSTSFLMIISLDRCTSVMCPVWSKNHRTLKLASIISSMVWSCCFLLSSPYLAFFDIVHDSDTNISYCIPMYAEDHHTGEMRYKVMFIARFIFMFIIPFSIIIICYSLITSRLRRIRSRSGSSRPFKVIVTIVLCFFCFWFPFHLWPFINYMNIEISSNVDIVMTQVVYCIGFFNSCVNPIVYVFVGRDFKKSLFKSIPFLLESTFRERYETEADHQYDHTMVATEMETFNA
ncbi:formyl peptide receptor-related sequence 4-like [Mixophyes fleayi]|uniref:formyl peptide receptor-related sequence 4-like n=1 Tax=Mixophyes fleayi TaxID=3061075 RepID=UPI003F4E212D